MTINMGQQYQLQLGANNPILRAVAEPVTEFDENTQTFCNTLMDLLREYEGVGLAAPQVGVSQRVIATTQWKNSKRGDKVIGETVMVNPEIVKHSDKQIPSTEACLSLPGMEGTVERYERIDVQYQDPTGKQFTQRFHDFNGIIVQHEIDHLDGVLFIDKLIQD